MENFLYVSEVYGSEIPKQPPFWMYKTNPANNVEKKSHYHQQIPQLVSVTGFKEKQPSNSLELGFPLGFLWENTRILSTWKLQVAARRRVSKGSSHLGGTEWKHLTGASVTAGLGRYFFGGFKRTLTRWWFPKMVGFPNKPMGFPI